MAQGLLASIYIAKDGFDCSNGGVSARFTRVVVTGDSIPGIFDPTPDAPEVRILPGHNGHGFRAVPADEGTGAGPMFGGAFVYTTDSRFPSRQPIPLHDRWER